MVWKDMNFYLFYSKKIMEKKKKKTKNAYKKK